MKLTIKFALVIVLFCSTAFADGEMGNGGIAPGEMGNGGRTCTSNCFFDNSTIVTDNEQDNSDNYVLTVVKDFLAEIFG